MSGLVQALVSTRAELAMLKKAFSSSMQIGPVEEIDIERGYRLKLGDGPDGPFLSPWLAHPESGKTSIPLRKGDVVGVLSPSGDLRQGAIFRAGYTGEQPNPSADLGEDVLIDSNGVRLVAKGGELILESGNFKVAQGNTDLDGGYVKNDGKFIDKSHQHKDVVAGSELSGQPK